MMRGAKNGAVYQAIIRLKCGSYVFVNVVCLEAVESLFLIMTWYMAVNTAGKRNAAVRM